MLFSKYKRLVMENKMFLELFNGATQQIQYTECLVNKEAHL